MTGARAGLNEADVRSRNAVERETSPGKISVLTEQEVSN